MKAVAVYLKLKLKLKEQFVKFPPEIMPFAGAMCLLEITIIINRERDIQIFLNGTFCSMEAELTCMGL